MIPGMIRLASVLTFVSLCCACAADPAPKQSGAEPSAKSAKPAKPAKSASPEPVNMAQISITPDEAAAAGLAKLGFSLDTTGTGMSGSKFGAGAYLTLSGPPGGPLTLRISAATIGAEFSDVVGGDAVLDATLVEEQVELLGETRRAAAWITGSSMARTSWCAVIVGPSGAAQADPALLLELGIGHQGDEVVCATALEAPQLRPVIDSLKLLP